MSYQIDPRYVTLLRAEGFTDDMLDNLADALARSAEQDALESLALQSVGEAWRELQIVRMGVDLQWGVRSVDELLQLVEGHLRTLDATLPKIITARVVDGQPVRVQTAITLAEARLAYEDVMAAGLDGLPEAYERLRAASAAYRTAATK